MSKTTPASDQRERQAPSRLDDAWHAHIEPMDTPTAEGATAEATSTDDAPRPVLLDRLVSRHRERQRRYHRIEHVDAVIARVLELAASEQVGDLDAIVAAAFWHDAVYEPQHPANERASARLAARDLGALGWSAARCQAVAAMIEATATHTAPADPDTAVLLDADLAILGADEADYAVYVSAVRAEYSHLDDGEWRTGRAAVLQAFIDRDPIFATATGRARWESAARRNLDGELETLRD